MAASQLCWDCKKACGGCSWSRNLVPVKGWTAKRVKLNLNGYLGDTYEILEGDCPEHVPDGVEPGKDKKNKRSRKAKKKGRPCKFQPELVEAAIKDGANAVKLMRKFGMSEQSAYRMLKLYRETKKPDSEPEAEKQSDKLDSLGGA